MELVEDGYTTGLGAFPRGKVEPGQHLYHNETNGKYILHLGKRGGVGRSLDTKIPVFGLVERGGRVIAKVTPDAKVSTVFPIAEHALPASTVYTDG